MPMAEKENEIPNWTKILLISAIALFSFGLSNFIFVETTSDIQEFMGDHNFKFKYLEFFAIIMFLIVFYLFPGIFLSVIKRLFPKKISINEKHYFIISLIFSGLFIAFILEVVFPRLTTIRGPELDGLWYIVFWWLWSILVINCLLSHSFIENECNKIIEMTGYQKKLGDFCERFSIKFK